METIDLLKKNELFNDLGDLELGTVAALMSKKTVQKHTQVISEGDSAGSMYLIKEGKVNVTLTNEDGKEMILATLLPGDHFGELALLDDSARSANVIAVEKCEFAVLHKADFFQLLENNSTVAISVIKYLCRRVRFLTDIAQSLALLDVYGRLVKLLHNLASPTEDGRLMVTLALTHRDIAARVGSSREMISRILSELEKGQYLTIENKIIFINKKLPAAW